MVDDKKTLKFQMMMSPSEAEVLDDWMFKHRIRSRAEAIRRLTQIGMTLDRRLGALLKSHLKGEESSALDQALNGAIGILGAGATTPDILDALAKLVAATQAREQSNLTIVSKMVIETWPLKQPIPMKDAQDFRRKFQEKLDAMEASPGTMSREVLHMLNTLSGERPPAVDSKDMAPEKSDDE